MSTKIIEARITEMPKNLGDPMPVVWVKVEGISTEQRLFSFYPDEIMFRPQEFIGLTVEEARALFTKKDVQWLRSSSYSPVH